MTTPHKRVSFKFNCRLVLIFHDGGPYHIETSPMIWIAN